MTTRFAGINRWLAVLILLGTAAAIGECLVATFNATPPKPSRTDGRTDWDFYRGVIERVRAGESYYEAVPKVFKEFGYQTYSLFNYRTPIYAWLIGGLPSEEWSQAVLIALAALTLAMAYAALKQETGPLAAMCGVALLLGGLGWCLLPMSVYAQELWACTLITMSISLYVLGRWPWAVFAGLTALFFRELTLPYCLLALGFSFWQRRSAEIIAWFGGLALYGLFMSWHLSNVARLVPPGSGGGALSWITFGGVPFLLATARMHIVLLALLPPWPTAFYLPIAVLGLAGWRGEMGTRVGLTVAAYLAAFSVVGLPVNIYWGLMDAPLLGLGLLWAPVALRDLWRAIWPCDSSTSRDFCQKFLADTEGAENTREEDERIQSTEPER